MGVVLLHTALGILHTHRRRGKSRCLLHTDIFFFVIKIKIKTRIFFLGWYFAHRKKINFFMCKILQLDSLHTIFNRKFNKIIVCKVLILNILHTLFIYIKIQQGPEFYTISVPFRSVFCFSFRDKFYRTVPQSVHLKSTVEP